MGRLETRASSVFPGKMVSNILTVDRKESPFIIRQYQAYNFWEQKYNFISSWKTDLSSFFRKKLQDNHLIDLQCIWNPPITKFLPFLKHWCVFSFCVLCSCCAKKFVKFFAEICFIFLFSQSRLKPVNSILGSESDVFCAWQL